MADVPFPCQIPTLGVQQTGVRLPAAAGESGISLYLMKRNRWHDPDLSFRGRYIIGKSLPVRAKAGWLSALICHTLLSIIGPERYYTVPNIAGLHRSYRRNPLWV